MAKFAKLLGKFLWSSTGDILRVVMGDFRNLIWKGGLGLMFSRSMSVSLLLSQLQGCSKLMTAKLFEMLVTGLVICWRPS